MQSPTHAAPRCHALPPSSRAQTVQSGRRARAEGRARSGSSYATARRRRSWDGMDPPLPPYFLPSAIPLRTHADGPKYAHAHIAHVCHAQDIHITRTRLSDEAPRGERRKSQRREETGWKRLDHLEPQFNALLGWLPSRSFLCRTFMPGTF